MATIDPSHCRRNDFVTRFSRQFSLSLPLSLLSLSFYPPICPFLFVLSISAFPSSSSSPFLFSSDVCSSDVWFTTSFYSCWNYDALSRLLKRNLPHYLYYLRVETGWTSWNTERNQLITLMIERANESPPILLLVFSSILIQMIRL